MASISRSTSEVSCSLISDTSNPLPPESLANMENEEIKKLIAQTEESMKHLDKEVKIFERYLKRIDFKDTQVKVAPVNQVPQFESTKGGARKKGRSKVPNTSDKILKLTLEQKSDVISKEIDELKDEIEQKIKEQSKVLEYHKATIIECECMIADMNKSWYEFDRDIIRGGINPRTGKLFSEKIIKYFEDYVSSRNNLMEKLRLKSTALRTKRKKLLIQLKQKEESGEERHEIDFEQLKIENQQLHEKINMRNNELLKLKLCAGKIMQKLNYYKKKVAEMTSEQQSLNTEFELRSKLMDKVEKETEMVIKEKTKAEVTNHMIRNQLEEYSVPDVMDYVKEKASQYELRNTLHIWQRKVEIAEMTLHTYQQTWHQLTKKSLQYNKTLVT